MAKKKEQTTTTSSKSSGTTKALHTCKSAYQDKRYGHGIRVWNNGTKKMTCTVCGEEKRTG